MERDVQLALGKILGEIYRVQKEQGICEVSDARIMGLLNGFQQALESELEDLDYFSNEEVNVVADYLKPYWTGEKAMSELPTLVEARLELERKGVSHGRLLTILEYLHANGRYTTEIKKWIHISNR